MGMAWYGMVWHGMAWHGMAWHGMAWYGMALYGMVWNGIVLYGFGYLYTMDMHRLASCLAQEVVGECIAPTSLQ